jgi:hypothetical protein
MNLQIHIPDFEGYLQLEWEPDYKISAKKGLGENIIISANAPGLISLARHLLSLTQPSVESGHHYHFDDSNSLETGSIELIIEKVK